MFEREIIQKYYTRLRKQSPISHNQDNKSRSVTIETENVTEKKTKFYNNR